MIITIEMLRRELRTREHWSAALVLLDEIEGKAFDDDDYAIDLERWLSGLEGCSTVFLRDTLCEPLRLIPRVVAAGDHFNATTEWHNSWIPIDTAVHRLRCSAASDDLSHLPNFGIF